MRLTNTLRNMIWNLAAQFTLILTGILFKRVLLNTIGTEKVGLNYVLNDIVGLISIFELGLIGVIAYYLYEPLAKGNTLQIIKILSFFRKAYAVMGAIVIAVSLGVMPFLSYIIGNTSIKPEYIYFAFLLFLLRNTEGYFFSYKQILAYADQKSYIVLFINIITNIVYFIGSVFVILYTRNYLYVLFLEFIKKIITDFILMHIINRWYPYINTKITIPLEKSEVDKIGKDMKNASISNVSKALILTSDNIIMTIFLGLYTTGLFSNYTMVIYTIQIMLQQVISSAQASIGNMMVTENKEVIYSVTRKITFISFFIVSISGNCLMQLTTPFISLFFGEEYVLSQFVVLICIFNIYLDIMQRVMIQLSESGGLFHQIKKINFMSCMINIILSIIGVKVLGITGVLLGTMISRTIEYSLRIKVNFKELLNLSPIEYSLQNAAYLVIFIFELGITHLICYYINISNPLMGFVTFGVIAGAIPVIINVLFYRTTKEFAYMLELIQMMVHKSPGYK